jgi:hypothetical protein
VPDACDPDPACSACQPDASGILSICHIPLNPDNMRTVKGECDDLSRYFNKDGSFENAVDRCGPCKCAYANDVDTDGDGVCDRKDECPTNPNKSKNDACGCDDQDSDGDKICDSVDVCPGSDDRLDEDGDSIPDGCDEVNYCGPYANNSMEWIASLRIDNVTLTNDQLKGYSTYSGVISLEQQMNHELEVIPDYIDDICELTTHIFIDLNGDGDFEDSNEELYQGKGLESVLIPLNIDEFSLGQYRMRVMVYTGRLFSLCEDKLWGEVEDFIIDVINAQPCHTVYEGFDYDVNEELDLMSGGIGWSGTWTTEFFEDGQTVILPGSLETPEIQGDYNKLGILSSPGSSVILSRSMNLPLRGTNDLMFSILIKRVAGSGQIDINLGGILFGVDAGDQFYLGDVSGPRMESDQEYLIMIKVKINQDGSDEILLWVNPDMPAPDEGIALRMDQEIGDLIEQLQINVMSGPNFLPLGVYIDQIKIGCDENYKRKKSKSTGITKNKAERLKQNEELLTVNLWPNPSDGTVPASVSIEGTTELAYPSQLTSYSGQLIWEGTLFTGINRLKDRPLPSGIYFLSMKTSEGTIVKKIVAY